MTSSLSLPSAAANDQNKSTDRTLCIHCDLPVPIARRGDDESSKFCCFGCRFAYNIARPVADGDSAGDGRANTLTIRLGLGIFLAMNVMVFSWLFYSPQVYGDLMADAHIHRPLQSVFAYLLLFLAGLVVAVLGTPIAEDAVSRLFCPVGESGGRPISALFQILATRIDANLLICIGVFGAYALSAINTFRGVGDVYYDTAVLILLLVTLGHYVDSAARRRAAGSMDELLASVPEKALVRRSGNVSEMDAADVIVGDLVSVRGGEAAATDGIIVEGECFLNEASLTGESKPRSVAIGDNVLAGAIVLDGQLWLRATRVGGDRTISRMRDLLDQARRQQLPLQRLADQVAAVFVPLVILLAIGVLIFNAVRGNAVDGLFAALSVLLISCPCALGLAAPLATWSALRRAAKRGILIDSAMTLEKLASARVVAFDKTGTLTEAKLVVNHIETFASQSANDALRLAAAIEQASAHPIAKAIGEAAEPMHRPIATATQVKVAPGLGVSAMVDGVPYHLGSVKFAASHGHDASASDDGVCVFLFTAEALLARFELNEKLRDDAVETVSALQRMGIASHMLTGDEPASADVIADQLKIDRQASLLPEDKMTALRDLQKTQRSEHGRNVVIMVGDGLNDAPVLAAADVGVAMGGATDLASQAGHVRLLRDRLDRVPLAIRIAKHGMRRVKLNLLWAFGYNTVGLTLAAIGLLSPIFAASAMFASSLFIITTSRKAGEVADG